MKKRHFTLVLLIWLFSQQIFAAVGSSPEPGADCGMHHQNVCLDSVKHLGHTMPMVSDSEKAAANHSLPICDHCSTVCQPGLLSIGPMLPANIECKQFDLLFLATPDSAVPGTRYRPPIFA